MTRSKRIIKPFTGKKITTLVKLIVITGALLLLSACAPTQQLIERPSTPGFFSGLWHGFIAPISFIISLFNEQVRIYGFPNAGRWYDFGFMLGIGGFSSGIFAGSRRKDT